MEKDIKNADAITRKFGPASTRATTDRLEAAKKERRKREEMMERQKVEAMATKRRKAKGRMILSNEKKDKNNTGDNTDPDQDNDKYPLQL